MSRLEVEVAKFRKWTEHRLSPDFVRSDWAHADAEWECDYPDWQSIYLAVDSLLQEAATRVLTSEEWDCLSYALARDNEDEVVLESLCRHPSVALAAARQMTGHPDPQARWQIAVVLGRLGGDEAIGFLEMLQSDADEYVRRRSQFALKEAKH